MQRFEFEAIGTRWQIDLPDQVSVEEEARLLRQIQDRIEKFDQTYSRFRPDSLVTKMSLQAGTYTLPADAKKLLDLYQQLYDLTSGAFTPLIGQVLVDAGYDTQYSLQENGQLHQAEKWTDILEYTFPTLTLKKPALLDFGAAGKGYLVDLVGQILQENKIKQFCVDAGGDILYHSDQLLEVGLEHPQNLNQVIGIAKIKNQSICGSAGNRRNWGKFHHIIHPDTLTSPSHILATWVVAEKAILADGLATCLFFVPSQKLIKDYNFEYLILDKNYQVEKSAAFPAELFYQ